MPFASDQQRKFLYSQKPEVAQKFAQHEKPMQRQQPRQYQPPVGNSPDMVQRRKMAMTQLGRSY